MHSTLKMENMRNFMNYMMTAMLFLLSAYAMGHHPHRFASDLIIEGEANIVGGAVDECEPGEAWCYDGEHIVCKDGEWVVIENCHEAGKMCHPTEPRCVDCIPAEYNSPAEALLIKPDTSMKGILCTAECEDWYMIEVPAGKTFYARIDWEGGGGVFLELFDGPEGKIVARLTEFMEIAYTHNGETAVFYLKASNDSSRNKLSGYHFSFQLLDDYEPWERP